MTYLIISAVFLAIAIGTAIILGRRRGTRVRPATIILAGVALVVLTAVFDNLMIAAGLFEYADGSTLGVALGLAPLEDFAYPVAAVILLPAVWAWLRRDRDDR